MTMPKITFGRNPPDDKRRRTNTTVKRSDPLASLTKAEREALDFDFSREEGKK